MFNDRQETVVIINGDEGRNCSLDINNLESPSIGVKIQMPC